MKMKLIPAPVVVQPPDTVVLELTKREAFLIRALLGNSVPNDSYKIANGSARMELRNHTSAGEMGELSRNFCNAFNSIA